MSELKISNQFKEKSTPVNVGVDLSYYIGLMRELLLKTGNLAISAPEIGVYQQFFVMDTGFKYNNLKVIINPIIDFESDRKEEVEEGCKSAPNQFKSVKRPELIHVQFYNEDWKLEKGYLKGINARVFIHQYEHLQGKCIFSENNLK